MAGAVKTFIISDTQIKKEGHRMFLKSTENIMTKIMICVQLLEKNIKISIYKYNL